MSWIAGGDSILYTAYPGDSSEVRVRSMDGLGQPRSVFSAGEVAWYATISNDERWLILMDPANAGDIHRLELGSDSVPVPLADDRRSAERGAVLSPNGRLLAFVSDGPGVNSIYVRSFPAGDRQEIASTEGGTEPRWARNGRELFYRDLEGQLISVTVESVGNDMSFSNHRPLFDVPSGSNATYDVSPDGNRFLFVRLVRPADEFANASRLIWAEGLFFELEALVPPSQ